MSDDPGEQASGPDPRDREMSEVVEMAVERYLSDWRASLRKFAREHAGATIEHEHQTLYGAALRDWNALLSCRQPNET